MASYIHTCPTPFLKSRVTHVLLQGSVLYTNSYMFRPVSSMQAYIWMPICLWGWVVVMGVVNEQSMGMGL